MVLQIAHLDKISETAEKILAYSNGQKIFLFYGGMGAGKTTLIKEMCTILKINDWVSSPTFSIVNEYSYLSGSVFHFDFYRLKNESEALDLGYEDYFYSGNYCFIEWPEKIKNLIPENNCTINIEVINNQERRITVNNI